MIRKTILFLAVIIFIGTSADGKVRDFRLKNLDNKTVSYSQVKGEKVTVIDFWATWCKHCVRSIPKLIDIYERYNEEGVQFIGISVDSPRNQPKVKPLASSLGITYPVLLDSNSQIMSEMKVTFLPTLLIIDENDEIIFLHQGYRPGDEKLIEQEIKSLLGETQEQSDEK